MGGHAAISCYRHLLLGYGLMRNTLGDIFGVGHNLQELPMLQIWTRECEVSTAMSVRSRGSPMPKSSDTKVEMCYVQNNVNNSGFHKFLQQKGRDVYKESHQQNEPAHPKRY